MTASESHDLPTFEQVIYEKPAPKIAKITLNRPAMRNAQGLQMTYDLDRALSTAAHDEDVSVIIVAGAGPDFNSGHDLSGTETKPLQEYPLTTMWGEFTAKGQEGFYAREKEIYLEITERWRNIPKPVIAQVHGRVIAGGIMLAWFADLIVCSEDARFLDNTPDMGINGVEWFHHPYEMPARRAKEWLFMTEWMTAQEAYRVGMVNRVVPREELDATVLAMATRIAEKPLIALKAIKESVNTAQDMLGRRQNMQFTFALHHMLHSHHLRLTGLPIAVDRLDPKVAGKVGSRGAQAQKDPAPAK